MLKNNYVCALIFTIYDIIVKPLLFIALILIILGVPYLTCPAVFALLFYRAFKEDIDYKQVSRQELTITVIGYFIGAALGTLFMWKHPNLFPDIYLPIHYLALNILSLFVGCLVCFPVIGILYIFDIFQKHSFKRGCAFVFFCLLFIISLCFSWIGVLLINTSILGILLVMPKPNINYKIIIGSIVTSITVFTFLMYNYSEILRNTSLSFNLDYNSISNIEMLCLEFIFVVFISFYMFWGIKALQLIHRLWLRLKAYYWKKFLLCSHHKTF